MTSDKIKESLEELGYRLADRGAYWQTTALYRGGDNQTALQIYKDSGTWKDYVAQTPFLPFKALVEATLKTNDPDTINAFIKDNVSSACRKYNSSDKVSCEKIFEDSLLDNLLPHYKFYNDKGISDTTLKPFKGGLATRGQMYQRFVFPIYNENNQIHGFSGRLVISDQNKPKWKHMGRKTSWVYPFYLRQEGEMSVQADIMSQGEVFLVESIGDMLALYEHGVKNVIVIFGLDVSSKIACTLSTLNLNKIHIALNNDFDKEENRGLNAAVKNLLKLLNLFSLDHLDISLPVKNDFGEMDDDDFSNWRTGLENKDRDLFKKETLQRINHLKSQKSLPKTLLKNVELIE